MKRVLVTGGAGFIGAHVALELLEHGYEVRALDSLVAQVHGDLREQGGRPSYLPRDVELVVGDVRDRQAVRRALDEGGGVGTVVHLAARVGVGQSMYEMAEYTSVNTFGTAVLLEEIARRPVGKLVVASSMSVYGEGLYRDGRGAFVADAERTAGQLAAGRFEVEDGDGRPLDPVATPESKPPALASIYAQTKYDQERLCLLAARAGGYAATALRLFNVYGPHQALSNPYTGVLAIFAARLRNGRPPLVFEDGGQRRDFVHVRDVARAFRLALETPASDGAVLNVGSGHGLAVLDVARRLAESLGRADLRPTVTGRHRVGDIRHCFADVARAEAVLGYAPRVPMERGLEELAAWLDGQVAVDRVDAMLTELEQRGLVSPGERPTR